MGFAEDYPGFRLRITRWGGVFLIAVLVLALAAVNTGNNALMVLLGFALGSYAVSGTWSRQVLGRLRVRVEPPREVFAGRPTPIRVHLHNTSRLFPAYGVILRDGLGRVLLAEHLIPAGQGCDRAVSITFAERGWIEPGPWRIEILLPLGFFKKTKEVLRSWRLLVYPRLAAVAAQPQTQSGGSQATECYARRGREGEFSQLRDFMDGDEVRQIHWKQTARQKRLVVVERQRRRRGTTFFALDPHSDSPDEVQAQRRFEEEVSRTATAVIRRLQDGEAVGLIIGREIVALVSEPAQAAALLRPLAEVKLRRFEVEVQHREAV